MAAVFDHRVLAGGRTGIAVVLGIGFGVALERAGFGSARKLTAVFYLHDMAVVKVMFTAVVTTMAGLFVLSALGLLDLARCTSSPPTCWRRASAACSSAPAFSIGGYCPGTSVAAVASGRKDAVLFALGMLAGVVRLRRVHAATGRLVQGHTLGEMTLPTLTGVGMGWWTLAFIGLPARRRLGHEPHRRPEREQGATLRGPAADGLQFKPLT